MSGRLIDLTEKRFGRWTVLALWPERYRGRQAVWLCSCTCGTKRTVVGSSLRSGNSTSCGCLQRENLRKPRAKHGHARTGKVTRAYACWACMLQRCRNPNATYYCHYGARGISVCEWWLKFENFYTDMGDPPPGMSIDRIDNNDGYRPGNCRWETPSVQRANQRPPKRKRRRSSLAEIDAYAASLARAASAPGGVRAP
jgi:hypothetical protein